MYAHHPLAEAWPMMNDSGIRELAVDIREHGQAEPIVLFEGMVLDGRNRLAALLIDGIVPVTVEYAGGDPAGFVRSMNHQRRHLTPRERQAALRKLEAIENGRNGNDPRSLPEPVPGRRDDALMQKSAAGFSSQVAIAREAGGSRAIAQAIDREAREMIEKGEAATAAEAYEKVATPPSKRGGRSRPKRSRQGKLKDTGNPATESEKRYQRLEHVVNRCLEDYRGRSLPINAEWIGKRLSVQAWERDLRPDVIAAAAALMALTDAVDATYAGEAAE